MALNFTKRDAETTEGFVASSADFVKVPRPRVGEYGPRIVRESRSAKVGTVICGGLAVLAVCVSAIIFADKEAERKLLATNGLYIEATITDMSGRGDNRRIEYRYDFQGQTRTFSQKAKKSFFNSHQVGDKVLFTTSPADLDVRRMGQFGPEQAREETAEGIAIGFLLLTGLGIGIGVLRFSVKKQRLALSEWPATSAKILDIKTSSSQHGTTHRVRYQFDVRGLPRVEKTATFTDLKKSKIEVGEYVDVVYNPERPEKCYLVPQLTTVELDDGGIR